ncbi:uncharacterized protein LOC62_02G003140 [Vanrija pseudolonga]|uniref:Uncharacterized protein n=1 Tax=Vanrija pseudolonga TaxID=143232 RepID=A0AAF0Y3Z5_9TREE|nr:hypothetical protein LOC62_02G003140 [Vanrija pseudolonga]
MCNELKHYLVKQDWAAGDAKAELRARFSWLDDDDFAAACDGTLGPKYLYRMIPELHPLNTDVEDLDVIGKAIDKGSGQYEYVPAKICPGDAVGHFMTAFPNMTTLTVAWTNLVSVMAAGARDPAEGMRLMLAMNEYFSWLAEASDFYTWESVCKYHIRFTRQLFHKGAKADKFADMHNGKYTVILNPK